MDWFGKGCKHQCCQFEKDGEGVEDTSSPILIYCNSQEGTEHDHEGNCTLNLCPLSDVVRAEASKEGLILYELGNGMSFNSKIELLRKQMKDGISELDKYNIFDSLLKLNLPQDSVINGFNTAERFGSLWVDVSYTVSDKFQKDNDLHHKNRILSIRLIQGSQDKGLPIMSFGDRDDK